MSAQPERKLRLLLRVVGLLDFSAVLVVFVPLSFLTVATRRLGLEPLPDVPLTQYILRTASALYAFHGVLFLYLSRDIRRYAQFIEFLSWAALVHGSLVQAVMWRVGMPGWWQATEAIGYFGPAIGTLWLLRTLVHRGASS